MAEVNKSQPKSPLNISLTVWSTVRKTINSINEKYKFNLNLDEYEDRLAFVSDKGLLTLKLVKIGTGELDWVVVDESTSPGVQFINAYIDHPKSFPYKEVVKNFGIVINDKSELDFLKDVKLDVKYNSGLVGSDKSFKLMNLLNNYLIGDGWTSNPSTGCTTAYFVLRYFGSGADAPGSYNFNRDAKCLAVVELMMYGEYQLHALVVR